MRLDELLDTARRNREEQQAFAALAREAERRASAEELARRDAAFREWLGDLAEDLGIGEPAYGMNPDVTVWSLRPRIERLVEGARIEVVKSEARSYYTFKIVYPKGYGPAADVYSADDAGLPSVLLHLQSWNEVELSSRIASWEKVLDTPRDKGCSDDVERLRTARAKLNEMAPEHSARWAEIHARSVTALVDWQTEEAEKAAVRGAAVERYVEALEAWADEWEKTTERNRGNLAALQEWVDVGLPARELEYAVVADGEYEPHLETRTALVSDYSPESGRAVVYEAGRARPWTFRHVVRVGDEKTWTAADPAAPRDLFLREHTLFGTVVFPESLERTVRKEIASWDALPEEPSWDEYGAGLPAGRDVYEAAGRAKANHAAVESDPF